MSLQPAPKTLSKLILLVIIAYAIFILKIGIEQLSEKESIDWVDYLVLFLLISFPVGALAALRKKIYTPPRREKRPAPPPVQPPEPKPVQPTIPDLPDPPKRGFAPPPTVRMGDVRTATVAASIPSHLEDFIAQGEANIKAERQK